MIKKAFGLVPEAFFAFGYLLYRPITFTFAVSPLITKHIKYHEKDFIKRSVCINHSLFLIS